MFMPTTDFLRALRPVLAGAVLLFAAGAAPAQSARDTVIATVNGVDITEADLALAEEDLGEQLAQVPEAERRDYMITYLADIVLLVSQAAKEGLGNSADFPAPHGA